MRPSLPQRNGYSRHVVRSRRREKHHDGPKIYLWLFKPLDGNRLFEQSCAPLYLERVKAESLDLRW